MRQNQQPKLVSGTGLPRGPAPSFRNFEEISSGLDSGQRTVVAHWMPDVIIEPSGCQLIMSAVLQFRRLENL